MSEKKAICPFLIGEIRLARQCLHFQGFYCKSKSCLNEVCPLHRKHKEKKPQKNTLESNKENTEKSDYMAKEILWERIKQKSWSSGYTGNKPVIDLDDLKKILDDYLI